MIDLGFATGYIDAFTLLSAVFGVAVACRIIIDRRRAKTR